MPTTAPLGRIALGLSGGGFRAAAYHLGTLKALQSLGLLESVRLVSAASGGSILAGVWLLSIVDGKPFEDFEGDATAMLRRNIVAEALDRLDPHASLIQRAADVYDELFGRRRLGEIADSARLAEQIDHVVINATHFSLGYGFRFTIPPRPRARFGNRSVRFPGGAWRDIRLADAVAASSCFPAGFEPLAFPDDFRWTSGAPAVEARPPGGATLETSLPLMDGGIYDNQASGALMLIEAARGSPEAQIGLLFCSDTDQKQMPFYARPQPGPVAAWAGGLSVGGAAAAFAAASVALSWAATRASGAALVASIAAATLCAVPLLALLGVLGILARKMPFPYPRLPQLLLSMSIGDLLRLASERLFSVLALTTTVFMSRVRALGYDVARLKMPRRVVESHIYDVETKRLLGACERVRERAARARAMPTTLWMTDAEREEVVFTGSATAVATLRHYLRLWRRAGKTVFRTDVPYPEALEKRVEEEWRRINDAA